MPNLPGLRGAAFQNQVPADLVADLLGTHATGDSTLFYAVGNSFLVFAGEGIFVLGGLAVLYESAEPYVRHVIHSGVEAIDLPTFTPGDADDPRVDLVCIELTDTATSDWQITVVEGTPDPAAEFDPAFGEGSGNPAIPENHFVLAGVDVPALAAAWGDCTLTDVRTVLAPVGLWNGGQITQYLSVMGESLSVYKTETGEGARLLVDGLFVATLDNDDEGDDELKVFGASGLQRSAIPAVVLSDEFETGEIQALKTMLVSLGLAIEATP
jgi:hypothetical protein